MKITNTCHDYGELKVNITLTSVEKTAYKNLQQNWNNAVIKMMYNFNIFIWHKWRDSHKSDVTALFRYEQAN